jgi:signal transduction histidine kinase
MRFRDLKLGAKQGIGFGVILLVMAGVNAFSLNKMGQLKAEVDEVTHNWLPRVVAIADINLSTANLRLNQLEHAFATQAEHRQEQVASMTSLLDRINRGRDDYEALSDDPVGGQLYTEAEQRLYHRFDAEWEQYQDQSMEILALLGRGRRDEAVGVLAGASRQVFDASSANLNELVRISRSNAFAAAERAELTYMASRRVLEVLFAATILLSVGLAWALVRLVVVPVGKLERAADSVARGDTAVQLEVDSRDEIGNLSRSFNQMTAEIRAQQQELQANNLELRQQSESLSRQKVEIERQNQDLEETLARLRDAQQQLVLKEKMASLGDLVAGVAHEINNPIGAINSIAGTSSLSVQRMGEALEAAQDLEGLRADRRFNRALAALNQGNKTMALAGERIARIVRSLRNFARLDEAELQEADLHEGLDSTLILLDHVLKNRIEVRRDYGALPRVKCYPNQLNQVFMNVISNAAQAIEGKGVIDIETRLQGDEVCVLVRDSGNGISAVDLEKIFNPGFTTKGVGVGTGLGLSISYNIVERHGGRFQVKSQPDEGTSFGILLPLGLKNRPT